MKAPERRFGIGWSATPRFANWIGSKAETLGCKVFVIDGQETVEENAMKIAAHFGLEAAVVTRSDSSV